MVLVDILYFSNCYRFSPTVRFHLLADVWYGVSEQL